MPPPTRSFLLAYRIPSFSRTHPIECRKQCQFFQDTPDVANPSIFKGPLPSGVLHSIPAKAEAFLDANGSLSSISLLNPGSGYLGPPRVIISPPNQENAEANHFRSASALIEWNATTQNITGISILEKGRGYKQPPTVKIEGGSYFLKITDPTSTSLGLHLPIISNSDYSLELNNSLDTGSSDGIPLVSEIIQSGQFVEVVMGWTLGSLFGSTIDELKLHPDINASQPTGYIYSKIQMNRLETPLISFHTITTAQIGDWFILLLKRLTIK